MTNQKEKPESISVPTWAKTPNGGLIRRESLEADHPLSTYNYVKEELGLNPEDFGIPPDRPYACKDEPGYESQYDDLHGA